MDDQKKLQLQNEIEDYLKKESEISTLLEKHIASLIENLDKLTETIKNKI